MIVSGDCPARLMWEHCYTETNSDGIEMLIVFKDKLCEDYIDSNNQNKARGYLLGLLDIKHRLEPHGRTLTEVGLEEVADDTTELERERTKWDGSEFPTDHWIPRFSPDQQEAYNTIMEAVKNKQGGNYFIDGKAGCGKTILLNTIAAELRKQGEVVIIVASTGIAALNYPGGTTAHSAFKLPLDVKIPNALCRIGANSQRAVLLRHTTMIIWDEFCVNNRHAFETLQRSLTKDIMPFGKKLLIVCAGDFRQIPPIVKYGSKKDVIKSCILYSDHWQTFTILKLTTSQRDRNDPIHAEAVLKIGEGRRIEGQVKEDNDTTLIPLPHIKASKTLDDLIDFVYPEITGDTDCTMYMQNAILAGHNSTIDDINTTIMDRLSGEYHTFYSYDYIKDQDEDESAKMHLTEDVLNCLNEVGIPPHIIRLKVGGIAMITRNISFEDKLCNSTKVIIDHIYASKNWIRVRIPQGGPEDADRLEDIFRITFDFEVHLY